MPGDGGAGTGKGRPAEVEAKADAMTDRGTVGVCVRFWVSLVLTVLVIALAVVVPQLGGHVYSPATQLWGAAAQLVLATPVVLWGGWPHLLRGWAAAKNGSPDRYTLIGFAAGIAYAYSIAAVLWAEVLPEAFRGAHGRPTVYFTAATMIVTFALLGELLGSWRSRRAGA